ncbi:MAG: hypothetical protein ACRDJE_05500 [Dehalococcoidia bacterium]
MSDPEHDDLDRLFTLAPTPSPKGDVGQRARARLRALRGARRLTLMAAVDAVALVTLAMLAFLFGAALADGEAPALIRLAIEDRALAVEARDELLRAIIQSIPWIYVLGLALNTLALYAVTTRLLRATDAVSAAHVGAQR